MAEPVVELVDVSYAVDRKRLVDGISWRIMPRDRWALLGPNGAGKTTLIKMVGGLTWPNAGGHVLRHGARLPNLHAMRRGIGWVSCELGRRVPARERVMPLVESGRYAELGLRPPIRTDASASCQREALALVERLGFVHLGERRFVTLSQGEQQIVLLARALMAEPSLVILDEPCAGLDPDARETFLEVLSKAIGDAEVAPAAILVTHHMEEVVAEIDQLFMLKGGEMLDQCCPADGLTEEGVERLYGRRPQTIRQVAGRYWPIW